MVWDYFYPNNQSARLMWYHDHALGQRAGANHRPVLHHVPAPQRAGVDGCAGQHAQNRRCISATSPAKRSIFFRSSCNTADSGSVYGIITFRRPARP